MIDIEQAHKLLEEALETMRAPLNTLTRKEAIDVIRRARVQVNAAELLLRPDAPTGKDNHARWMRPDNTVDA